MFAVQTAGQQGGQSHRPRQRVELLPETVDHPRDVESQHETDRDLVAVTVAVDSDKLERPDAAQGRNSWWEACGPASGSSDGRL